MKKFAEHIQGVETSCDDGALYFVSPSMNTYDYVVVSNAGGQTMIFGADKYGEVDTWAELYGSFRGDISHEDALARSGYKVVTPPAGQKGAW